MPFPFDLQTALPAERQRAVERWLSAAPAARYVFGRTAIAHHILDHYPVAGVIDDFTPEPMFDGVPVVRTADLAPGAPVLSAVIGKPLTVRQVCDAQELDHVDYFAFHKHCGNPAISLRFWKACPNDLALHGDAYAKLWQTLADDASRQVLESVLTLRLSGDLDAMAAYSERQHEQYFEPFLHLARDEEVFIDIGGFDGATSIEFARRCPGYRAIHVFEPDPRNIDLLAGVARSLDRMTVHGVALGPEAATLRFTSADSRSRASDAGEHAVQQVRLDTLNLEAGTFLKMDIEGAELGAIAGAADYIRRHQPRLAIAAYHKVDDLWRIPAAVSELMDADIYLRHYTEGLDETVMFFMPRQGQS